MPPFLGFTPRLADVEERGVPVKTTLLLLFLLTAPLAAAEPSLAPKKFIAAIGGFLGASYRVELSAPNRLTYEHNPHTFTSAKGTQRTSIRVTPEQWRKFRKRLDAARVWSWKPKYSKPKVRDGTVWTFVIEDSDRSIVSHGNNAYPDLRQFEQMRLAVEELLGGKNFR